MKKVYVLLFSLILLLGITPVFASAAPHHNHIPGKPVTEVVQKETCTTSGSYKNIYYCKTCGKFIKSDIVKVKATGHDWETATCMTPETCNNCGKTKGKALGHNWVDATCLLPETCLVCGEINGEALGHVMGEAVLEVEWEPTCEETGRYKYNYYCTVCEKFLKFDRVDIPALGHNWEEATCTTPETCLTCGKTNGEAVGHVMGEAVLQVEWEPTCEETGRYKYNYYCTVCEKFLKFDRVDIPALGHN
ncbi:MAG: hypothetical protein IKL10_05455, partial [Clostridia bacterium]|nr:hypothetical protein [Clostridia bacterium]